MATNPQPILQVNGLSKSFDGARVLDDVHLSVPAGAIVSLLGRSGSGKTTLLQLIAGLQLPDAGSVHIGGRDMAGVPAFARPVNTMFQSYALFPHLSVADNIVYGLRARGIPKGERSRLLDWALDLVRLQSLERRRPDQLSGGQRQRVALARCLVMKPQVLLLDEPMAALDKSLRADVQRELTGIQRRVGTTFILVTHDQDEAMALSDYIAVMDQGHIVQFGTPRDVYEYPRTSFVASFLGSINLFEGSAADLGDDAVLSTADGLSISAVRSACAIIAPRRTVGVRPEKVVVSRAVTPFANHFPGTIEELSYCGNVSHATIRLTPQRKIEATLMNHDHTGATAFRCGESVHVGFPAEAAVILSE